MNQFWHRGNLVAQVRTDDETQVALLNLKHQQPLVLHGSAVVIWGLIDGTRTEADILTELQAVYGSEDGISIEEQLRAFLRGLSEQGLAEARNEQTATIADPDESRSNE
jgi:hypothetical protein